MSKPVNIESIFNKVHEFRDILESYLSTIEDNDLDSVIINHDFEGILRILVRDKPYIFIKKVFGEYLKDKGTYISGTHSRFEVPYYVIADIYDSLYDKGVI